MYQLWPHPRKEKIQLPFFVVKFLPTQKGKVLFLGSTVTLSVVPPKEELSNRHSATEISGKALTPKWVPMKRIPCQFYQNSSLQPFGESAIRPFILYSQIKGTRQTSIVIPKKILVKILVKPTLHHRKLWQNDSTKMSPDGKDSLDNYYYCHASSS